MRSRLALLLAVTALLLAGPALAGPTSQQRQMCAAAQELGRLGRDADAQAFYLKLVEAGVACKGAAAALHPSWPRRVTQFVSAWWSFAVYAALVVGFVFGLATRYRPIRGAIRRVPIVGGSFQPRVSVAGFDSSATGTMAFGKAATGLVNNGIRRLAGDSLARVNHIAVSTGVEGASATVGKLGDLGTQFKALSAVMGFLAQVISIPRYQLAGTLQPNGGEGLGLSLTLDRRSRAVDATTLWVRPGAQMAGARENGNAAKDDPRQKIEAQALKGGNPAADDSELKIEAFQTLALLASAWVEYAMRRDELPGEFEFTPSPKSYAYFRLGVLRTLLDEPDTVAIQAYRAALEADESNVGAMLNLAVLLRRSRDDDQTAEAQRLLDRALVALEELPEPAFKFIWYQIRYSRVALLLNRAAAGHDVPSETYKAERGSFLEESMSMLHRLGYISAKRRWMRYPRFPERQPLEPLVRRYGWYGGLMRWRRPPPRGFARFLFENAEPNAILFAVWDIQPDGEPRRWNARSWGRRGWLAARLRELDDMNDNSERYSRALEIVERFVAARRPLSYRTKYNLACYYASREPLTDANRQKAKEYLSEALQDAPPLETVLLARRAISDPTLKSLRTPGARGSHDGVLHEPTQLEAILTPFWAGMHGEPTRLSEREFEEAG